MLIYGIVENMNEQESLKLKFSKEQIVSRVAEFVDQMGYEVVEANERKPWGAYWRIREDQVEEFVQDFFPKLSMEELGEGDLSPKLLLVAPDQRLSWQYHDRRAEIWSVVKGPVLVCLDDKDKELSPAFYFEDEVIKIPQGMRHRLISDGSWGLVAEIWRHTDPNQLSDEADIVRLADDYSR